MLVLAIMVAIMGCDSSRTVLDEVDIDTLDIASDVDALDWYQDIPASIRVVVLQRDTAMSTLSYRVDASLDKVQAGYTAQTSATETAPAGYWLSGTAGNITAHLGDIGFFAGTGLLLGSAGIGFRSVRSVPMPRQNDKFIEPWKSRYRTPALRGFGLSALIDSGAMAIGLAAGRALSDSTMSYAMVATLHRPTYTVGFNILRRTAIEPFSASCWLRTRSGPHSAIGEIACTSQGLPAVQVSYAYRSPLLSLGLSAWMCADSVDLPLGSLSAVSSRPQNIQGVAISAGQTIRSLVGWNVWLLLKQSMSRTYNAPFPESEISLRTEIRQTVTSQLHIVWRGQASRDDDGVSLNGIRAQKHVYRVGLQSTIERIIRPTLLWRARADVRWIWDVSGTASSTTTRVEVIWRPHTSTTLRARALQFASPTYLIAPRIIDYVSRDLQRMVYCNGYGLRWSLGAEWTWNRMISLSALASVTHSPTVEMPVPELWIGLSGYLSRAPDMHLPQEENAEQ
jgi:hypothetical protein